MLVVLHEFSIEVTRMVQLREVERHVHVAHLVNDVALVTQSHDERIAVLTKQFSNIDNLLEQA